MNMREKMARAMCKTWDHDPDGICASGETYWEHYLPQVTAVLDALSEPTFDMVGAAHESTENLGKYQSPSFTKIWKAMINAAKEE